MRKIVLLAVLALAAFSVVRAADITQRQGYWRLWNNALLPRGDWNIGSASNRINYGYFNNLNANVLLASSTETGVSQFEKVLITTSTDEQLKLGYDASHYLWFSVGSTGETTVSSTNSATTTFTMPVVINDFWTGTLTTEDDAGVVSMCNAPIVSSASGVKNGYTFDVDGSSVLRVAGRSDGAGGAEKLEYATYGTHYAKTNRISGNYTVNIGDDYLLADTTGGSLVITISSEFISSGATNVAELHIIDYKYNAAVNNITIATEGSELIDNAATFTIAGNGDSVDIICDGSNCHVF